MAKKLSREIKAAIKLLKQNGFTVEPPAKQEESEYWRAVRTGVMPEIWPPLTMTRDELYHFRETHGL